MLSIFLLAKDSPGVRQLAPTAFLLAGVTNILLVLWVIIYFNGIYAEEQVKVPRHLSWDAFTEMYAANNEDAIWHGQDTT